MSIAQPFDDEPSDHAGSSSDECVEHGLDSLPIASAMGVQLGIALEIQGGANAPSPFSPGGMMIRAAAETITPVESGDQLVTASVTVKYRILEGGS